MSSSQDLVSVIMPVYNSAQFVDDAISSVLEQCHTSIELILIDDGSSDGSTDLLKRWEKDDPRVELLVNDENLGAGLSRNLAIEAASGRYVAFLDADDIWEPCKLGRQLPFLQAREWATFTYSAYRRIGEAGSWLADVGVPDQLNYRQQLRTNYVGMLTLLYDRHAHHEALLPTFRKRQDYGFTLRLLQSGGRGAGINTVLASHRQTPGSLTSRKLRSASTVWPVYREVAGLDHYRAAQMFTNYAVRGLFRSRMPRTANRLGLLRRPGPSSALPSCTSCGERRECLGAGARGRDVDAKVARPS